MSSNIRKVQNRVELKNENTWLRNAFRKSLNGLMEQNNNVVDLTTSLVVAIQQAGGSVTITKAEKLALDPHTRLRAATDEHGNTVFTVYVDEPKAIVTEEDFKAAVTQAAPGLAVNAAALVLPSDEIDHSEPIEGAIELPHQGLGTSE